MFSAFGIQGSVILMDVAHFTAPAFERSRRLNQGEAGPPVHQDRVFIASAKAQHHPHPSWWQALKGLGKRRRKSTTSAHFPDNVEADVTWHVSQVENLSQKKNDAGADFVSCLAYDDTGQLLAAGCKSGKVAIFCQDSQSKNNAENFGPDGGLHTNPSFHPFVSFQSHEREFDYLRSVDIDEKINKLRWLKRGNPSHFLLSTNERTVKLWKISERYHELDDNENNVLSSTDRHTNNITWSKSSLRLPRYRPIDRTVVATPRRTFFEAHDYRINSLSLSSDLETFITADDLRINLWHIEVPDQSFNVVDTKPESMDELSEVITTAEFHPEECSWFVYGSTKGSIRLCDMRSQALCDKHAKTFVETVDDGSKTFFSDIIGSVSDLKFSESGRYLLSRDYLNMKVWDLQMESRPVETYPICETIRSKLCTLYENDHIFDKFECSWGCNDRFVASGTYSNYSKIYDRTTGRGVLLDSNCVSTQNGKNKWKRKVSVGSKSKPKDEINTESLDFQKKLFHSAWHPTENLLTNGVGNCLVFLNGRESTSDNA